MTAGNPASSEHAQVGGGQPVLSAGAQERPGIEHPHAPRFRVVLAVLAGIAVAALAIAVVVVSHASSGGGPESDARWSSWAPDNSAGMGAWEIAQYISPYYRQSAARQLDVITPIQLAQTSAAATTTGDGLTIAVDESSSTKGASLELLNGRTIAYNVCGLGAKDCEVTGTPSIDRMLLLRREALELALYTFEYIGGSQNVVVVLPPGHTATGSGAGSTSVTVALLFLRSELLPWLDVPLSQTLQQYPPELSQLSLWSKTEEAGLVDQITAHGLFSSQVESQQEGGNLLVLTPLPAQ